MQRGWPCGFFPEKERVEFDVTGAYSPFQNDAYLGLCAILRYPADPVDGPGPARAPRPVDRRLGTGKITDYMQGALAGFLAEVLALTEKALARRGHAEEGFVGWVWSERGFFTEFAPIVVN